MKVALTVWEGRISPVFDSARELVILTVENGVVASSLNEAVDGVNGSLKAERLVDLGIETLICGAISESLRRDLTSRGVDVVGFVAGDVDRVLRAYLTGDLPGPVLAAQGCCGKGSGLRARRGYGQGPGKGRRRGQGKRRGRGSRGGSGGGDRQ